MLAAAVSRPRTLHDIEKTPSPDELEGAQAEIAADGPR